VNLTDGKKAYLSFNASIGLPEDAKGNDPVQAENWQVLSPVRNHVFGTTEINRKIQAKYRGGMLATARNPWSQVVKPFGEQEIVYTDKVMQSINCRKTAYGRPFAHAALILDHCGGETIHG
jgi:exodeoxyribonuclease V alpha subunit